MKRKPGRPTGSPDHGRALAEGKIPERDAAILENRFVHKMTLADSAIAAGHNGTRAQANSYASTVCRRYRANGALAAALEQEGADISEIARKIAEGLEAVTNVKIRTDTGQCLVEVPDQNVRHRFVETALDIYGAKAPKRVVAEVEASFEERLRALADDYSKPP